MSSKHDPSIDELRAQAELARAALGVNVTELRGRIARVTSPGNIKAEVRGYVRDERESLVDNLRQRASDNPLQAAAVAAAVAYPALSLLRAIPMPLMLIGAGLFLTTKRGQESSATAMSKMNEVSATAMAKINDASATMTEKMNDATRRVSETVGGMTQTVTQTAGDMREKVTSRVSETVSGLREKVAPSNGTMGADADPVTTRLATMASETFQDASQRATRARGSATRFASDNAMLLAGAGVLAGALLAASFPVSNAENRVLGPGKRRVKDAARAAAAMGIDKAGSVVADAVETVSTAAKREGLDGESLQQAVGGFAEKARAVAERSFDAALGEQREQQDQQQSYTERNPT